jgi:hypothetical protein
MVISKAKSRLERTAPTRIALLVVGAFTSLASNSADASILVPESPSFSLSIDDNATMAGGTANSSDAGRSDEQEVDAQNCLQRPAGLINGSTSSGTSTTATGNGGGGLSPSFIDGGTTFHFSDTNLSGWLSGEQHFELPTPPGNDLLRPPQL